MSNQTSPVQSFIPPDWSAEPTDHLEQLRAYAETKIEDELDWYRRNKHGRAATSRPLRFWAVLCTILGGRRRLVHEARGDRPAFCAGGRTRGQQSGYAPSAMPGGRVHVLRLFGFL